MKGLRPRWLVMENVTGLADRLDDGSIGQFLSVEVQAIDITGSVREAYYAILANTTMARRPTYGMNWDNV